MAPKKKHSQDQHGKTHETEFVPSTIQQHTVLAWGKSDWLLEASRVQKRCHISKWFQMGIRQWLYWPLPINSQLIQSFYLVYFDSRDIFHSQNLIVIPQGFKKDNNDNTHKISTSSKVISAEILNLWCGVFPYYCWDFHIIHVLEVTCK